MTGRRGAFPLADQVAQPALARAQFGEGLGDGDLLMFEFGDARLRFFQRDAQLFEMLRVDIVHLQHLANVGEGEAEPLAAQHQDEPRAVAMGIDALIADALRREQPCSS